MAVGQKIVTHLWYDQQAEEAARFYVSLFPNSKVLDVIHYGKIDPGGETEISSVKFQLDGQLFLALNAGPQFKFNESFSMYVNCETQEEVDRLWDALIAGGGEHSQCGWLKDRFGLSWQIVPTILDELIGRAQSPSERRALDAMLKMQKLDIAQLKAAAKG